MKQEKESLSVKLTENGQKDEAFTNTCSSLEDTLRNQEREGGARQESFGGRKQLNSSWKSRKTPKQPREEKKKLLKVGKKDLYGEHKESRINAKIKKVGQREVQKALEEEKKWIEEANKAAEAARKDTEVRKKHENRRKQKQVK